MRLTLEKRLDPSPRIALQVWLLSLLLAVVLGALLLAAAGANPLTTFRAMFVGALGDSYAIGETLVKAIPLMLTGLAVAIAFRMRFWNIGAEGQLAMGGFAAAGVALFGPAALPWLPGLLWLPLIVIAGIIGGAFWGAIPALLKAYLDVNEIITTLMLNYIAILWVENLYYGPWQDPDGFGFPGSALFDPVTWLPRLSGRVHWGLLFALVGAALLWFLLGRTRWGYEVRLLGENPAAARYAGVPVARNIVLVMLLSGGLAGLAGAAEVSGVAHRLGQGLVVGHGFTAIIVAWLARLNPWGVIVISFLLAALLVGGDQLQIVMGLPPAIGLVLQGILFFTVLGGDIFRHYRLRVSGDLPGHETARTLGGRLRPAALAPRLAAGGRRLRGAARDWAERRDPLLEPEAEEETEALTLETEGLPEEEPSVPTLLARVGRTISPGDISRTLTRPGLSLLDQLRRRGPVYQRARLIANESGSEFDLVPPRMILGRARSQEPADESLLDVSGEPRGRTVSRHHAILSFDLGEWRINPTPESQNLTLVNGIPCAIGEAQPLADGDLVQVGGVKFRYVAPQGKERLDA